MIIQYSGVPTYSLDQISLTCCTKWPAFHQNYFAIKLMFLFVNLVTIVTQVLQVGER